jgi:hypothetical protein
VFELLLLLVPCAVHCQFSIEGMVWGRPVKHQVRLLLLLLLLLQSVRPCILHCQPCITSGM